MKHNQSGFYLSFQGGRGFLNVDAKDLSSRQVWPHGPQQKIFGNVHARKCFLKAFFGKVTQQNFLESLLKFIGRLLLQTTLNL